MLPVVLTFVSSRIAKAVDCKLNDYRIVRCDLIGVDIGGLLHVMNGFKQLLVYSLPVGLFFLMAWLVAELLYFFGKS
jgi:hypothetical protein